MITADINISFKDSFINSLKEPMFGLNEDLNIVVWNKASETITGVPADQVLETPFSHICEVSAEVSQKITNWQTLNCTGSINNRKFRLLLEPIWLNNVVSGYRGMIYKLDYGVLKELPPEYLIEVINASPISSIVFNLDGTILYSNNSYKELWNLSDQNLEFINHKYNLFLDKQLEDQGLMPFIKAAFRGEVKHSPVFSYSFNSSSLGRSNSEPANRLMAHMYPIHDVTGMVAYIVLNFLDVTEQDALQAAYRESKERLQLALKGANLGIWDWFIESKTMVYNDRWATMLGYTLEEVYEITWEGLLHPDDRERCLRSMDEFLLNKEDEYESEFRLRTKSGEYKWILDRGMVVEWSKDGTPIRAAGTHIDINDRKLNEQRIYNSEIKYRRLVDNAPIGIAIVDNEKIRYINQELVRMGKVDDPEKIYGLSVKDFLVGTERYEVFKQRESLVINEGKNAPLYSTQFRTMDGGIIDVEVVSIPINYERKPAMQVLIHDISDRKSALKELSRSQELLNQLFENAPMGIVFLDRNFEARNVNKGFEKIFGYSKEEVKARSLLDFIVPHELIEEANRLNKSAISGQIDYVESYRLDKNGLKKHLLIYALPVMEKNERIGIYGIYVDIGQRISAEEELKTRNLELDNFVYKVSHDLRAPLASILGLINLTKIEESDSDKDYYISLMEGQVNKLDHFIRDILSHSKNLKMSVAADVVEFKDIVQKCFDDLGYLKASSKVVRKVDIAEDEFISDKWRISEIFRNLIGNAIKYRDSDIEENIVEVKVDVNKQGCYIEVADNGIGIPTDKLPHVMEMFYRGTETSDGSGIGLYIVQKAVEKLGGSIKIESDTNIGTKFKIWLPSLEKIEID